MMKRVMGLVAAVGLGVLLVGGLPSQAAAVTSVTGCGAYGDGVSLRLDADLHGTGSGVCLKVGNSATIDMNGHSINGPCVDVGCGTGITGGGQTHITGPGIVEAFESCITLGNFALVQDVVAYDCHSAGITLGNTSKCVQCRVHDILEGTGITMGNWCLLESSIVETSQRGANVGHNCKIWDLVIDGGRDPHIKAHDGLKVGSGTSVARSVISHINDGPGIDYCGCNPATGTSGFPFTVTDTNGEKAHTACQDSSNSVSQIVSGLYIKDADSLDTACLGQVVTDCATNEAGKRYPGTTAAMTVACPTTTDDGF